MNTKRILALVTMLALAMTSSALAATREEKRVADAADVVERLSRIPEKSIPPSLLSHAYAVAVVPDVVRAAFGLGARRGKGIIVIRQDDSSWSNPAFITLTGGSVGWQIGAESTDVILVFKIMKSIDGIMKGKFTLGADAAIAAGPVGRRAEAATDVQLKAEIYSYSRSRGLFAGVSVEGAALQIDDEANADFYGKEGIRAEELLKGKEIPSPPAAIRLKEFLAKHTDTSAGE